MAGAGKSTMAPFRILNNGWDLRIGIVICYDDKRKGPKKVFVIFTTTIKVNNK